MRTSDKFPVLSSWCATWLSIWETTDKFLVFHPSGNTVKHRNRAANFSKGQTGTMRWETQNFPGHPGHPSTKFFQLSSLQKSVNKKTSLPPKILKVCLNLFQNLKNYLYFMHFRSSCMKQFSWSQSLNRIFTISGQFRAVSRQLSCFWGAQLLTQPYICRWPTVGCW